MNIKPAQFNGRRISAKRLNGYASLLMRFGIDVYVKRKGVANRPRGDVPLWRRSQMEVLDLLYAARSAYRAAVKRVHPDVGGTNQEMASLNSDWKSLLKTFNKRGYTLDA